MVTLVKGESSLYIIPEVTEGTFAPETLTSQAIEPNQDGLEFSLSRNEIERKTLTSTIEAVEPRLGLKTITGAIPLEFKAGSAAGSEPRGSLLYESLLGGKRAVATTTTTKAFGNTTSFLAMEDIDAAKYAKGDCVLVKKTGAYEVRPVLSVVLTSGSAGLNLAIPLMSAPGASVLVEKTLTYFHQGDSASFSVAHYQGGEILEAIPGCKANSGTLEGWTAGETPSFNFSVEGTDMVKTIATPSLTPDFSGDAKVPVIIHACAWLGQEEIDYTELSLSIENTKADLLSACSPSGKIGTRKTAFNVTASVNPYMSDANLNRWATFEENAVTSLFTYAFNPTATDGEFNQVVAIWMPNVKITNMPAADQDGVLLDNIELRAFRSAGNDTIYLGFI